MSTVLATAVTDFGAGVIETSQKRTCVTWRLPRTSDCVAVCVALWKLSLGETYTKGYNRTVACACEGFI